jgi:hypothetical protein
MKHSELKQLIHSIILENDDLGAFHQDLQARIADKMHNAKRSDYGNGDKLFTIVGSPVTFISDLTPDKKNRPRVLVKLRGETMSILRQNVSLNLPSKDQFLSYLASAYGDRKKSYMDFVNAAAVRGYDENDGLQQYWDNRKKL